MNELGYSTETTDLATPAVEASGKPEHSEAGQAAGQDGALNARAAEDRLPPRQDVYDATWGDNPQWDEGDLAGEDEGDLDGVTDGLPPRQDVNDATWGDSAQWDEADLAGVYDGDLDGVTDGLPPRQDVNDATWGDHPQWDEGDGSPGTLDAENNNPYDDQEAPNGHLAPEGDDATTDLRPQPSAGECDRGTAAETAPGESGDTASAGAESAGQSPDGAADSSTVNEDSAHDRSPPSASDRIAALEARLGQLERDRQAEPGTSPLDRYNGSAQQEENRTETRRWRLPTDARLGLGGTVVGTGLGMAAEHMATAPGQVLGYVGSAISIGLGVIAVVRENRKSKDERGPDNRGPDPDDDRARGPGRAPRA